MGILREIFGPSQKEIWQQLAKELDAQFVEGFLSGYKINARHKNWIITLDTYSTGGNTSAVVTRIRAPYVNKDGFRFEIYRRTIFTSVAEAFSSQNIETGFPQIDKDFKVKSDDEKKVRGLLSNPRLRQLLIAQEGIHFLVKDDEGWFGADFPEGIDELYFEVLGVIKDIDRLKTLYELFAETLNQLCLMGSAYENDPQVEL
jgi:hypothetical protein